MQLNLNDVTFINKKSQNADKNIYPRTKRYSKSATDIIGGGMMAILAFVLCVNCLIDFFGGSSGNNNNSDRRSNGNTDRGNSRFGGQHNNSYNQNHQRR